MLHTDLVRKYLRVFVALKHTTIKRRRNWAYSQWWWVGRVRWHDSGRCNVCSGHYVWSWAEDSEYPRLCGRCRAVVWRVLNPMWSYDDDEIPF